MAVVDCPVCGANAEYDGVLWFCIRCDGFNDDTGKYTDGTVWTDETVIKLTGKNLNFELRCPAAPEPCTYVRITTVNGGEELAYWDSEEWRNDPTGVIGAIMGALRWRQ